MSVAAASIQVGKDKGVPSEQPIKSEGEGEPSAKPAKKKWAEEHELAFTGYSNMGKLSWLDKHPCENFNLAVKKQVLTENGH